jgi:3-oxoacyl-[acyl-carrier protein] reductase
MNRNEAAALVTGSAAGIGRAIARRLAEDGFRIALNGRRHRPELERTKRKIEESGGLAVIVPADVTDPEEAARLVETVHRELGPVTVLVNNVGEFLLKPLLEVEPEEWQSVIASNLHSAFYVSRASVPAMKEAGRGRIVSIGLAGADLLSSSPNITPYAIAKSGLLLLTRSLSRELGPSGITANMVAPGIIDSGSEALTDSMLKSIPAGRPGTPEEVARVVSFLVHESSSYITGACINVGGGWESVR